MNTIDITTGQQAFLADLRNATASQHKQLEATPLSQNLMRADVTMEHYIFYLLHMKNVIAWCEEHIFPVTAHLFADIEHRYKLPYIEKDLAILRSHLPDTLGTLDDYNYTAAPGIPAALGYMYVIEGSTLGGRQILNHIKNTLGIDEHTGASFFAGYAAETGKRWKAFLDVFSNYAVDHMAQEEIIAAATNAFASIESYFI